ncbi:UbiX family flavin prenyltransferase [Amycolatopsis carbonis]|uniref:UbiX family flavin prenyltransferase n=1 Tax=Amycolatopsis carbonis TaxID=715471 RepID=A0A9Y2IEB7_9PSEU|nr:UbiX family flavin prenyltransferase [Amycolatopsis sp. 2-15]WIX78502.1 UbiX family flavin prenyltransferase [Amycolatopsis sp. 2-15]
MRLLEVLRTAEDVETHLVVSDWAGKNIECETEYDLDSVKSLADAVYDVRDMGAAISSGSFLVNGMIIAPCSVKTLSSVANAYNDNLLTRAADIQLKDRRKLVLLFRETPLNRTHLRLMLDVTDAGGVVMPPVPSMYHAPKTVDDIVNHTVQRALDQFGIEKGLFTRWRGLPAHGA